MVELTESRRKNIEKYASKFGVEPDTVDIVALWDSSLSESEAMSIVEEEILKYAPSDSAAQVEKHVAEEESRRYKELQHEKKMIDENREQAFETIKNSKSPLLDTYYRELRTFVKATVTGNKVHSLFVIGEAGLGKTFQILQELLVEGVEFEVIQGNITPLALFNKLCAHPDKTFLLDDTLSMIQNKQSLSLLFAAMWSAQGRRKIEWNSTSQKVNQTEALFDGKIILVLNSVPKENEEIQTLMSRCLSYTIRFNYQQKMEIIYELAKVISESAAETKKNIALADWLRKNSNESTRDLNLRTFFKIKQLSETINNWEEMALKMDGMQSNEAIAEMKAVYESGQKPKEQVREWCEKTGLKQTRFYYYRKKYLEMRG